MKYSAIVVAAGTGSRAGLGFNKVLATLGESTVIEQSLSEFVKDDDCSEIILVVKEEERSTFDRILHIDKLKYAYGGAERFDSVYSGLRESSEHYVMIHDGARPYLSFEDLQSLKASLKSYGACLLVVSVIDTIKLVDDGFVSDTPLRSRAFAAQTPQCFIRDELIEAYDNLFENRGVASDDAMVMERYGTRKVKAVIGSYSNLKVTLSQDFS